MRRVRAAFDQALALQRGQDAVHRLRGGVAGAREVGARGAGVTCQHAQHAGLRRVQAVRAQRRRQGAAEGVGRLDQQVADVALDAEAGYGMRPAELVAALQRMGAAGCNLEDTDHAGGRLRDPARQAEWLRAVRQAAADAGYRLVINEAIKRFGDALGSLAGQAAAGGG
jgi:2-methylisocitrate lyase-like PEP mutase family enzyme